MYMCVFTYCAFVRTVSGESVNPTNIMLKSNKSNNRTKTKKTFYCLEKKIKQLCLCCKVINVCQDMK